MVLISPHGKWYSYENRSRGEKIEKCAGVGEKKVLEGEIFHFEGSHRSVKDQIQLHSFGNRGLVGM
jgi:hypothetical protein